MPKISVIVPVYNSEKYLKRCLDSIVSQTLTDIEIICVNDGSYDKSLDILNDYAKKDKRIKVINKKNGGAASARNSGLREASGKYIGYIDSDDYIEDCMYERLLSAAEENNADMVSSGYFLEGSYTTLHLDSVDYGLYEGKNMQNLRENTIYSLDKNEPGLRASLCCKLFLSEILKKVQFSISEKLVFAEDKMYVLAFVLSCNSAVILKEAYYHYIINPDSIMHTPNQDYLLYVNEIYKCLVSLYEHENFTDKMRIQSEIYITSFLVIGINTKMGFKIRNLLWIDPYYIDKIPPNSKIVLYGAGELGRRYKKQLSVNGNFKLMGCIDYWYSKFNDDILNPQSPNILSSIEYDFVLVTIKNPDKAKEVIDCLEKDGVEKNKILWFEQKEVFWKYVEANGINKYLLD